MQKTAPTAGRKRLFLAASALLFGFAAGVAAAPIVAAQQGDEDEILAAVQRFFDGLASNDPEVLGREMINEGQMVRLRSGERPDDPAVPVVSAYSDFLESFGGGDVALLERMWDPQVLVHGPLAIVWTPYDFHNDGEFSHCGVDAFTMVKTESGWQTVGVAYTVEPTGCAPSPLGPPRR